MAREQPPQILPDPRVPEHIAAPSGNSRPVKTGLVLSGGGARGAYQVGCLKGLFELSAIQGIHLPFQILTGVSAGAVNIAFLASKAHDPHEGVRALEGLWGKLHSEQVFRTDARSVCSIGLKLVRDAVSGGASLGRRAQALLDTAPLARFLISHIDFEALGSHVQGGIIDSVALSATDYASIECISFYMGRAPIEAWRRNRRIGVPHARQRAC